MKIYFIFVDFITIFHRITVLLSRWFLLRAGMFIVWHWTNHGGKIGIACKGRKLCQPIPVQGGISYYFINMALYKERKYVFSLIVDPSVNVLIVKKLFYESMKMFTLFMSYWFHCREGTSRFGGEDAMLVQISPIFRVVQGEHNLMFALSHILINTQ